MRKMAIICVGVAIMALTASPVLAQDDDLMPNTSGVDFEDAVAYAELVLVETDENGVTWEHFRDEPQTITWKQRIGLTDDEVISGLEAGPVSYGDKGEILLEVLMEPTEVTFTKHPNSGATCLSGTTYVTFDEFEDQGAACGYRGCHLWFVDDATAEVRCVNDLHAEGTTGATNYCDLWWASYIGQYWNNNDAQWYDSDLWSCDDVSGYYTYYIDEAAPEHWSYYCNSPIVRFKYKIDSSTWRYMEIELFYVEK